MSVLACKNTTNIKNNLKIDLINAQKIKTKVLQILILLLPLL